MARIKGGMNARKKHNRVLKLAKGYRGARSKQYRVAKQSVMRALTSAFAGRKEKKRQFRTLWIARINAAARLNGLSYSKFMYGLKLADVTVNRKMLAELAVNDAEGFKALVEVANKMAENVIRFRKPIRLEPMSAYERLIIHSELANRDDVETESFGEEPRRRVVIRKKY